MNSFNKSDEEYKKELVAQYEDALAQNRLPYLDPIEICDLANWYAVKEDFDKAQEVLKLGFSLHPNNTLILIEQAYLYLDLANIKEAKSVINCINDEYNPDVIILKGEILLNEGKLDEADKLFQSLSEEELNKIEVLQNITQLFLNMGYTDYAIKWLKSKEDIFKQDETFIALMAECCRLSNDDTAKAVEYYNYLIDINPYSADYWNGLANTFFKLEKYEAALEAVEFALVADNTSGDAYQIKAHILCAIDDMEGSIKAYKKAISYGGVLPAYGYTFIGVTYNSSKEWDKAVESFHKALECIKVNPRSEMLLTEIYNNLCISFCNLGEFDEANEISRINCELNPENPFVFITDGRIKLIQDDMIAAIKSWDRACCLLPEVDTFFQISDFLIEHGYTQSAFEYLKRALTVDPDYPKLYNRLTLVCLLNKYAAPFCQYNRLASPPVTLEDINKYINSIDPELRDGYDNFIIEVNRIENQDS